MRRNERLSPPNHNAKYYCILRIFSVREEEKRGQNVRFWDFLVDVVDGDDTREFTGSPVLLVGRPFKTVAAEASCECRETNKTEQS